MTSWPAFAEVWDIAVLRRTWTWLVRSRYESHLGARSHMRHQAQLLKICKFLFSCVVAIRDGLGLFTCYKWYIILPLSTSSTIVITISVEFARLGNKYFLVSLAWSPLLSWDHHYLYTPLAKVNSELLGGLSKETPIVSPLHRTSCILILLLLPTRRGVIWSPGVILS